jgi:uracil-DNA glycosylase
MDIKKRLKTWTEHVGGNVEKMLSSIVQHLQMRKRLGARILPNSKDVFKALQLCSYEDCKVVILGQDPYHSVEGGVPHANGLCFSVNKEEHVKLPPSLRNIFKELYADVHTNDFDPNI